jgi:hypothetical protein
MYTSAKWIDSCWLVFAVQETIPIKKTFASLQDAKRDGILHMRQSSLQSELNVATFRLIFKTSFIVLAENIISVLHCHLKIFILCCNTLTFPLHIPLSFLIVSLHYMLPEWSTLDRNSMVRQGYNTQIINSGYQTASPPSRGHAHNERPLSLVFIKQGIHRLITVAARSRSWNVFAISNIGIVGSTPTRSIFLCFCCPVCPHPRSPTNCLQD